MPWWKSAVIYQIYPRSFCDSNGDGIGDIPGIISKLDYLAWLGVDAVWLSPFYPSPMTDFGYDIVDYTNVDPVFGTIDDFDRLLIEAHKRDIRVLIDWVPNHTSDQHPWFLESRSNRKSPKREWYIWYDPASDGGPPNSWLSRFGHGKSAWTWDAQTRQYYLHSFSPWQPDLNWDNPHVVEAMHKTLRFWLNRGADGFRIDSIPQLSKPEVAVPVGQLAGDEHGLVKKRPTVYDHLRGIRRVLETYRDRVAVGEVTVRDQSKLVEYLNSADGLHLAHNFVLMHQPWGAANFRRTVDELESLIKADAWPCWFLNNHDQSRVASRYDSHGRGAARARVAALTLLTLRGTPFLYQGEELGLTDVFVPEELATDLNGRDPQRAPIPWGPPSQAGPGAGFTSCQAPWLPISPGAEQLNAKSQAEDLHSILCLYRDILEMRRRSPALRLGRYESQETNPEVFGYIRSYGEERLLIISNFSNRRIERPLTDPSSIGRASIVLSTAGNLSRDVDVAGLALGPEEGIVLRLR